MSNPWHIGTSRRFPGIIGSGRPRPPKPKDNSFNPWKTPYPFPSLAELQEAVTPTSSPRPPPIEALPPLMSNLAREAGPNPRLPNPGEKVALVQILEYLSLSDLYFTSEVCKIFRVMSLDIIKSRVQDSTIVLKGFLRTKDISLRFSETFGSPFGEYLSFYICWTEMDDALGKVSARSQATLGFRQIQPIQIGGTLQSQIAPPTLGLIQAGHAPPVVSDQDPPHQFVTEPLPVYVHFVEKPGWHGRGTLCRCIYFHLHREESKDPEFLKWWEGREKNNQLRVVMPVYLLIATSLPSQTELYNFRKRLSNK
jgi:hypothetical protein